jgi:hypothetical protein
MTPIAESIRELLHATPFVPFTVHMADQQAVTVPHPDFASLTPGGGLLFVFSTGDRFQILHLRMATRVEAENAPQSA